MNSPREILASGHYSRGSAISIRKTPPYSFLRSSPRTGGMGLECQVGVWCLGERSVAVRRHGLDGRCSCAVLSSFCEMLSRIGEERGSGSSNAVGASVGPGKFWRISHAEFRYVLLRNLRVKMCDDLFEQTVSTVGFDQPICLETLRVLFGVGTSVAVRLH